jgi:alpha-tubulin suppressor-like RCC1 family protein
MSTRILLAMACVAPILGCSASPYHCETNAQCVDQNGADGICESDGYCSFADSSCTGTSRRYADSAGPGVANTCVAATNDACVADLAGGDQHFCMVRSDGTVWCWGANDAGQLGDGTTQDRATPTQVKTPAGKSFIEVRVSENHSCALAIDNTVWCWGGNDTGQLGVVDSSGNPVADSPLPIQVQAVAGTPPSLTFTPLLAKHISAGGKHTCAIDMNEGLECWGENADGQAGQQPPSAGGTADDVFYPTPVPGLAEGVVDVSLNDESSACLKDDGSVFTFGGNANGQLGDGTTTSSYTPVQAKITSVTALTSGDEHTCGLKNDDSIWCWGYGAAVGLASGMDQSSPQRVLTGKSAWAGGSAFHTCAVQGNALLCWGGNDKGQIGMGTIDANNATILTPTSALIATIARAASSTDDTCAITVNGGLWCWGANDRGQLAQGSTGEPSPVPIRVNVPCN